LKFANDISEFIYQEYLDIESGSHHEKVRFYSANKNEIKLLPYKLRVEISLNYVIALFETGDYFGYLQHVDQLLEVVIEENIYSIDGDDIYQELLFRKASSLHNIVDRESADHIFGERYKINSDNKIYQRAYLKNRVDNLRFLGQNIRAALISLFLFSGLIIGIEILFVNNYLPEYSSIFEIVRTGLFFAGIIGLLLQEISLRYSAYKALKSLKSK